MGARTARTPRGWWRLHGLAPPELVECHVTLATQPPHARTSSASSACGWLSQNFKSRRLSGRWRRGDGGWAADVAKQ